MTNGENNVSTSRQFTECMVNQEERSLGIGVIPVLPCLGKFLSLSGKRLKKTASEALPKVNGKAKFSSWAKRSSTTLLLSRRGTQGRYHFGLLQPLPNCERELVPVLLCTGEFLSNSSALAFSWLPQQQDTTSAFSPPPHSSRYLFFFMKQECNHEGNNNISPKKQWNSVNVLLLFSNFIHFINHRMVEVGRDC